MVVASGLLAVIVGGAFAFVLVTITELRGTTDLRRQIREELVAADTLEKYVIDLETGLRGFVITRDASFLQPANAARAALPASASALEHLAADEPVQLAHIRRIVAAMDAYVRQYARPLVAAVRRNDPSVRSVQSTLAAKQRVDALREGLTSFRIAERARLSTRDADVDQAARRATAAAAVGFAGSIVLILVFSGYLTRVIVQPLRRAALMADRLAGGRLNARMRETDVAEIGALERSFNVMAGSLETSRAKLGSLLAEQAALGRVATLVAHEASQAEVFTTIAEEIGRLLHTEEIRMLRYEDDRRAVVVASWGQASHFLRIGSRLGLEDESTTSRVFRSERPARIDDYARMSGPTADTARSGAIRCVVATPITVEGRLWGAMTAATSHDEPLPPETESRLGEFTELMATAIANTESHARADRLSEEQAALRRVATLVATEASPADVFARVAEEVASVLGDVDCALVRDEGDASGSVVAIWGANASAVFPVGARLPLDGDSVIASVLRKGRSYRLEDYSAATGTFAQRARDIGVHSAVGCAIVVGGRTWGAMAVASYAAEPFPAETESRIGQFSELVAMAIANADARAEVERLAEEQAALGRVATLVADGASPTAVFDAVAAEMEKLLDADRVALNRYEAVDEFTIVAHRGLGAWRAPPGSRLSQGDETVASQVRHTERPARIEQFEPADSDTVQLARASGVIAAVGAPIVVDGRLWGVFQASWSAEDSPPADTEARMAKFAQLLETAIANADSRDQLTASRTRLLTAGDEARRRVVRDLHDGAQQRLVHTIITLKLAQKAVRENDPHAESLMGEALEHAEQGNAALRELAHGILPAVLAHGGLRAGVDAMVARLDLPVRVDVPAERFGAEIEASAYFVVAEALTNVVKHAHAHHAEVRASMREGMLNVAVRDDGIGDADLGGHGLVGMADRVTALGGRLQIESPARGGTVVSATLPLSGGEESAAIAT
jgi:signal transduction histidine kinase/CHASE3 domain sensor protein